MTDTQGSRPAGDHTAIQTSGNSFDAMRDEELVRLAQERHDDPAAFAELYRRHLPRVYRFLLARLGEAQAAQDATAQTFLAALEGIGNYRASGTFGAWLMMIARHKAVDDFRARRTTVMLEAAAELPAPAPSPEQQVVTRLQLQEILEAMRALSPERAEALSLRMFGGMSVTEISKVMDKREAAVKMLVYRALVDLRQRLGYGIEAEP
jgi:RNA polymerase sigma-70 factor (ECF subfamily)